MGEEKDGEKGGGEGEEEEKEGEEEEKKQNTVIKAMIHSLLHTCELL